MRRYLGIRLTTAHRLRRAYIDFLRSWHLVRVCVALNSAGNIFKVFQRGVIEPLYDASNLKKVS